MIISCLVHWFTYIIQNLCKQTVSASLHSISAVQTFYLWEELISFSKVLDLANTPYLLTGYLNLNFCIFSGNLQAFPTGWNWRRLDFFSIKPNSTLLGQKLLSDHYVAFLEEFGMCYPTWLHFSVFENCSKQLAEQLLVLQKVCITSCFSCKDKTEHCCKG